MKDQHMMKKKWSMNLHDSIALHLACCMTHQEAHAALYLLQRLVLCWASYSRCLSYSAANAITGHESHNTCHAQACVEAVDENAGP